MFSSLWLSKEKTKQKYNRLSQALLSPWIFPELSNSSVVIHSSNPLSSPVYAAHLLLTLYIQLLPFSFHQKNFYEHFTMFDCSWNVCIGPRLRITNILVPTESNLKVLRKKAVIRVNDSGTWVVSATFSVYFYSFVYYVIQIWSIKNCTHVLDTLDKMKYSGKV